MSDAARRSKPFVRPATREDCIILAKNLRQEDAEEIAHVNGLPAEMSLLLGFHTSHRLFAVQWGDELVAVFGIGGIPGVIGFPWMLASPALSKIRKSFLRECRAYVEVMLQEYRHLENFVWAKNEVHVQWLKWLGFEFDPPAPFGINDEPFHRFHRSI